MSHAIERLVTASRWLLAPLYLGLAVALMVFGIRFAVNIWHLLQGVLDDSDAEILLKTLRLVEMVMVANFLVMVIIGGFALFIRQFRLEFEQLQWLDHVNPGMLKLKMSMSLLGISSVHLVEAFSNAADLSNEHLARLLITHLVLVLSTMAIAWVNRYSSKVASH